MAPSLACPACGRGNTEHTCVTEPGATPHPGDWTVCIFCAAVCEFGPKPDLVPRLVTQHELDAADDDVRAIVSRAVDAVRRSA